MLHAKVNIFFLPFLLFYAVSAGCNPERQMTKTFLYKDGIQLSATANTDSVVAYVQTLLDNVDDAYDLLVTEELIHSLKEKETCLEIIFPETINVTIGASHIIKLDRILIPISGNFSGRHITVFWGIKKYSSGPYVKKGSSDELKRIIDSVEWNRSPTP